MEELKLKLNKKFPCRGDVITELLQFVGDPDEAYPESLYIYGHSGTGKTAIVQEFLRLSRRYYKSKLQVVYNNCVDCYSTKILFENILEDLSANDSEASRDIRCDSFKDFLQEFRLVCDVRKSYVIVLDNAERLRDMDANVLPTFMRLQQLTGRNTCVVMLSQLPFEKYYCKTGLNEVITMHFPQYTKAETLKILCADYEKTRRLLRARLKQGGHLGQENSLTSKMSIVEEKITEDFFQNYLNLYLNVFYRACRDVPELKLTARKCFLIYSEPVLDGSIEATDVSRLWRHITGPLKLALAKVYMRLDNEQDQTSSGPSGGAQNAVGTVGGDHSVRKLAQSLELPYYAKYLLIAAFLASHNSAKEDKRLFVKNHGKQKKRMQTVNAKAKTSDKMSTALGPKSFTVDRLLAIFYAILEEKVGLTCNLLSQISTLVHLKLLSFVSGENNIMEGSARLQCTVGLEFVLHIGRVVGFNVRQYLSDFM